MDGTLTIVALEHDDKVVRVAGRVERRRDVSDAPVQLQEHTGLALVHVVLDVREVGDCRARGLHTTLDTVGLEPTTEVHVLWKANTPKDKAPPKVREEEGKERKEQGDVHTDHDSRRQDLITYVGRSTCTRAPLPLRPCGS